LVLNNLSCVFESGKRIGIVGRTGSGKSSLMVSLFRLTEISSGKIFIDSIDASTLGMKQLRKKK